MRHSLAKSRFQTTRIREQLTYVTDNQRDAEALARIVDNPIIVRREATSPLAVGLEEQASDTSRRFEHLEDSDVSNSNL